MRPLPRLIFCAVAAVPVMTTACAATNDEAGVSVDESALRQLKPAEIVASISPGETVGPLPYTAQPYYRALSFEGVAGDTVDVWVRSKDGDARAWLTSSAFTTLATNADAAAGVSDAHIVRKLAKTGFYYIVWRDENLAPSNFTVSLEVSPPAAAFTATAGTYLVDVNCIHPSNDN